MPFDAVESCLRVAARSASFCSDACQDCHPAEIRSSHSPQKSELCLDVDSKMSTTFKRIMKKPSEDQYFIFI